jgi:hypothetical protein
MIATFLAADMPMISFAGLIIEPKHAFSVYNVCESILIRVTRSDERFRDSPQNQFGK